MNKKKIARLKRALRTRIKLKELNHIRLSVHKSSKHIYAQIISGNASTVLIQASTLEKNIKQHCSYTGNIASSIMVGKIIAERAIKTGITKIAFDRSGFKFHGRIKALADSAKKNGLNF